MEACSREPAAAAMSVWHRRVAPRVCARVVTLALAAMLVVGCRPTPPAAVNEVVAIAGDTIPMNPADSSWQRVPEYLARLIPQDQVEPRLLAPSTSEVRVRALTSGGDIAVRLEWVDSVVNDTPGPGAFLDGCAIQVPRAFEPSPPAEQMGQEGRPVDIAFWRADWQASVDGRPDTLAALYPNAAVNGYPFEAQSLEPGSPAQREAATRYAPAEALGNRRVGPREQPVEDMVAEGPGTIEPAEGRMSRAMGVRTASGWAVVIVRPRPAGLAPNVRTNIAFAVWEGAAGEVGARKMRSLWVPLAVRE
jgi:DMSO reductase family type II enzyme heme b subunit